MLLNKDRADEKMDSHGLDALVATSPANVFYTSDTYPYGNSFALLPRDKGVEPALITSISGSTPVALMSPPWFSDVRFYGEFYVETRFAGESLSEAEKKMIEVHESWEISKESDPIALLVTMLEERGLNKGRIGVDESNLGRGHHFWERMKDSLPEVEVVPARKAFTDIRMVKTAEEIRRIGEATRITERAWEVALDAVRPGITEKEFAAFSDIAQPSEYRLQKGDIIRFDGGCTYMGYPCDMARSAAYKEAGEKLKSYWRALWEGEQRAVNMTRPGARASEIFRAAVETVRENGIRHYRRHHTGHGWGLEGYDPPTISPDVDTSLEEGMVLCFETPYYEVGWGGLLHEDVIAVTEGGSMYLSTREEELRVVG
jgi:Xaa-Pro dipeptidase